MAMYKSNAYNYVKYFQMLTVGEMEKLFRNNLNLICKCGRKLHSNVSKKTLMAKINIVLNWHSFKCKNLYSRVIPCYSKSNTKYNDIDNLSLKCEKCIFNEIIL